MAAFASSYIPTSASQVTRAADSASMIGNNFARWYNPAEGTLYAESALRGRGNDYFSASIGLSANAMLFTSFGSTTARWRVRTNSVEQAIISIAGVSGATAKQAGAYKKNDFAFSVNGSSVGTNTDGVVPVVSTLSIGLERVNGVFCNTTIKKIAYYPVRVTNEQLQGLTS